MPGDLESLVFWVQDWKCLRFSKCSDLTLKRKKGWGAPTQNTTEVLRYFESVLKLKIKTPSQLLFTFVNVC